MGKRGKKAEETRPSKSGRWRRLRPARIAGHYDSAEANHIVVYDADSDSGQEDAGSSESFPLLTIAAMFAMTLPRMLSDPTMPETGMAENALDMLLI